jgi:hypothetical protein
VVNPGMVIMAVVVEAANANSIISQAKKRTDRNHLRFFFIALHE